VVVLASFAHTVSIEGVLAQLHAWHGDAVLDRLILYHFDGRILRMWVRDLGWVV
jgi:hypothetical protein